VIEKLKMQTPNITEQNIEQIAKLFPNVITETQDEQGNIKKAIDFDLLKQSLSSVLVENTDERYRLDWPGKKAALLKANTPISKTLRPCREDSVNFDSTENVYIEGDNFEVLKILQESYLGKIKMIYIDPPYNTGKDFIYKDNFTAKKADYEEELGTTDEDDNKLFKNTDTNGRFHSDWLSMMYERLIIARDLLKEDGVIFISIDDNEVHNLREICDEVFGEDNYIADCIRAGNSSKNNAKHFSISHDNTIVYAKSLERLKIKNIKKNNVDEFFKRVKKLSNTINDFFEISKEIRALTKYPRFYDFDHYTNYDEKGAFRANDLTAINSKNKFPIIHPITKHECKKSSRGWAYNEDGIKELISSNRILFGADENTVPQLKCYLEDSLIQTPKSIFFTDAQVDTKWLKQEKLPFDFPKPVDFVKFLSETCTDEGDIVLDFFSGSATTAHAIMQLNAEDNGNRKFIMVQLPEATDEKSEAYKAGYKTIAEIGKERIRRAGQKIVNDKLLMMNEGGIVNDELLRMNEKNNSSSTIHNSQLDIGFRVYKTDSSNMKEVYYHPEDLTQDDIFSLESNIKEDRTPDDLLTQVILDLGLELNLPIEQKEMHGNNVFIVQTNALVACFDDNINIKIIDEIAGLKPFKVVFKDASFSNSKDRINLEERFKRLSPETLITVI